MKQITRTFSEGVSPILMNHETNIYIWQVKSCHVSIKVRIWKIHEEVLRAEIFRRGVLWKGIIYGGVRQRERSGGGVGSLGGIWGGRVFRTPFSIYEGMLFCSFMFKTGVLEIILCFQINLIHQNQVHLKLTSLLPEIIEQATVTLITRQPLWLDVLIQYHYSVFPWIIWPLHICRFSCIF